MDIGIYRISDMDEEAKPMSREQFRINNFINMEKDRNVHTRSIFKQKPYYMLESVKNYGKSK